MIKPKTQPPLSLENNGNLPHDQPPSAQWNYEAIVIEIEEIIHRIESGDLELADLFEQFETAVTYLRQCEDFLKEKQTQVDLLIETLEEEI